MSELDPEFRFPDHFPKNWTNPHTKRRNGYTYKYYKDGTESVTAYEDGEVSDVETDFSDGSVHFEWDLDSLLPKFLSREELEAEIRGEPEVDDV
ncbi:MAG TPA: hypothetical protein VG964_00500 [Candidatus Saccharimonadales bacterium]|nr:hypothetical protein [Candidatus Saccharimonadales bacterium]